LTIFLTDEKVDVLEKYVNMGYDIILLDIIMPYMDGMETLKNIRSKEEWKKIPVIMLTNLAGQQDAEAALLKGAVKYIVKSEYEPKEVVDMVK